MNYQNNILLAVINVLKNHDTKFGTKASRKILFEVKAKKIVGFKSVVLIELENIGGFELKNWAIENFENIFSDYYL